MKKYFGTDGIRGVANKDLTPELAFKVGKVIAKVISENFEDKPSVIIGKDTRISSSMLEAALTSGLTSGGVDVYLLGVVPTPAVAFLAKSKQFDCGIMISASHNPFPDNGIKIFGNTGYKLPDEVEIRMERLLEEDNINTTHILNENIGRVFPGDALDLKYEKHLIEVGHDLSGLKIALDCANGATYKIAEHVFSKLGATLFVMANTPNGVNINNKVGSTHPEALAQFMSEVHADVGFSFDGDGDRVIAIDEKGIVRDGDYILYLLAKQLKLENKLQNNTVVATVMSNLGFYEALAKDNINVETTGVGDRYVVENMLENSHALGGEQSGHVIIANYATTGDGILTAIVLANALVNSEVNFSKMCDGMQKFPQRLNNIRVSSKKEVMENEVLLALIAKKSEELGNNGRILVRESGTEELVRVMAEAKTIELCDEIVDEISSVVLDVAK